MKHFKFLICLMLLVSICAICACAKNNPMDMEEMDEIMMSTQPLIQMNSLYVYEINQGYLVSIEEQPKHKYVLFDINRQVCFYNDIELIDDGYFSQTLGNDFDSVQELIGKPHVDVGSGFFIPAYITKDAYLISFGLESNKVVYIGKTDLFSNEIIEKWVCQD